MKKKTLKIIIYLLCFACLFSFSTVFAEESTTSTDKAVIRNISRTILDVLMWFAYAIILGGILFFGIKYMLSGANEKANIKGMIPKFIIGVIAITCCFTIAQFVANITGNDSAEDIINVGNNFGIAYNESTSTSNNENIPEKSCLHDGKRIFIQPDAAGFNWYLCELCGERFKVMGDEDEFTQEELEEIYHPDAELTSTQKDALEWYFNNTGPGSEVKKCVGSEDGEHKLKYADYYGDRSHVKCDNEGCLLNVVLDNYTGLEGTEDGEDDYVEEKNENEECKHSTVRQEYNSNTETTYFRCLNTKCNLIFNTVPEGATVEIANF